MILFVRSSPIKTIRILILYLLIIPLNCLSQWSWQNPLPQGNNLSSVRFVNNNTAFAVGDGGTILKTTDKGVTWTRIYLGAYQDLTGVFFVNPQVGYIVGADNYMQTGYAFKTINGGSTWIQLPVVFDWQALSVWFTDVNTGFVGTFGDLYKTTDGGVTWQLQTQFPIYQTCWTMCFTDSLTGYIGTSGTIFKTTNGGNTWISNYTDPSGTLIMSMYFTNQQTGFGVGGSGWNGKILKTTNAGQSWTTTGVSDFLNFVFFADNQTGLILGTLKIYRTTDSGNTWHDQLPPVTDYLMSGSLADSMNAIVVGYHGATVMTNDMGISWNAVSSHVTVNHLSSLEFIGKNLGFAAGDSGTIIKTTDGGNSWVSCPTGTNKLLECLSFSSSDVGYVCGLNNTILKTINGGTSWFSIYSSPSINDFTSIQFPSSNIGYVLCSGLMKTTDAGNSWNFKTPPGTVNSSMFFTSQDTGYFCGPNGQIVMTANGGDSYTPLNSGVTNDLSSIYFPTKNTGFALGNNLIIKTNDAGNSWAVKYSGSLNPGRINFSDPLHGFIVSLDTILITKDGGETWSETPTNNYSMYPIYSIWFTDSLTGYISGVYGILLKTTTGGVLTGSYRIPTQDQVYIYPNPNTGQFFIKMIPGTSGEIQVYDLTGVEIYKTSFKNTMRSCNINLPYCKSGIYFLKIVLPDQTLSTKIIVCKTP